MKNKKIESIKKNEEFSKIYSKGKTLSNKYVLFKYLPSKKFHLGLSVSKKNFKTAVRRNKIKRQIKNIFNSLETLLPIDLFIIAKPQYDEKQFHIMKEQIIVLYKKIK